MSEKVESVRRAMWHNFNLVAQEGQLAANLEAQGWTYSPPPRPVLPVVSHEALAAYSAGRDHTQLCGHQDGLRAAFKVMTMDNMKRNGWHEHTTLNLYAGSIYRALTGEEWPST